MKARRKLLPTFAWPREAAPTVTTVGRYFLDDLNFESTYQSHTHALHWYEYAAVMRLGDRELELQPNDVTITPAQTPARYHVSRPGYHLCVHFKNSQPSSKPAHASGSELDPDSLALPVHLRLKADGLALQRRIMDMIQLRVEAAPAPDALRNAAQAASLQAILLWLAMRSRDPGEQANAPHADAAVRRALMLLERRLDQPLNVPRLADEVELSQNYLARRFREQVGMTISRYLLTRRIELAQQLLQITDLPIHRIAARVGLPDPQYFNKQFRRVTGDSPSACRSRSDRAANKPE